MLNHDVSYHIQSPACFIYSTPVQRVSLGYTWKANNSSMTPIQYTLGDIGQDSELPATPYKDGWKVTKPE